MYDIGIIGAGPAGYSAAIRASQYGFKVVLFEKQDIGGTCLNRGCIPTKSMLHSAEVYTTVKSASKNGINVENVSYDYSKIFARKTDIVNKIRKSLTQLISGYGIEIINSEAQIIDKTTIEADGQKYECKNIIIATGSAPNKLNIEGDYDGSFILDSDDILNKEVIPENILIVGSGAIGIEWARIFSELDKKVTIVELAPTLVPIADIDVSNRIERIFKRSRIQYFTNTSIKSINNNEITLSNDKIITADCILMATGRKPVLLNNDFSKQIEAERFIKTKNNFQTNFENIYAVGDVNGKCMLAHSAIHQAIEAIEFIKNKKNSQFDSTYVPFVIFGTPEIAWVGRTEQHLMKENIEYKKSIFPIAALGKAYADDKIEGFVKILADDEKILGAHIVSNEASGLIQQLTIAMQNNTSPTDLTHTIFAHPTYSEGVYEAILGLDNLALHLPLTKI